MLIIMKFPVKFCGTWLLLFSNNAKFNNMESELSVDYENVVFTTKTHYPLFHIENEKRGFLTKIDCDKNTARVIWNKNRNIIIKTPVFPSIIIPTLNKRLRGERINFSNYEDESKWISIGLKEYDYTFRKINRHSTIGEDFPAFHKLLITQLILTEITNTIIDNSKQLDYDHILSGISRIHL